MAAVAAAVPVAVVVAVAVAVALLASSEMGATTLQDRTPLLRTKEILHRLVQQT